MTKNNGIMEFDAVIGVYLQTLRLLNGSIHSIMLMAGVLTGKTFLCAYSLRKSCKESTAGLAPVNYYLCQSSGQNKINSSTGC